MDFFGLIIAKEKLLAIFKFRFFRISRLLKTYLRFIEWLRDYIVNYVDISKSLQNRKTKMLRHELAIDNARCAYFSKTQLKNFIEAKLEFFRFFQDFLFKSLFLVYVNIKRSLFINLNISKKFGIKAMLYYIKKTFLKDLLFDIWSSRHIIKSILFLNRLIIFVKFKYWFTKLKIVDIVWILKKIRHIVKASLKKTIIYTNYEVAFDIALQTTLFTIFINKLNLKFIRVSDYIQRFNLNIRYKLDKQYIVSNVLFKLFSDNIEFKNVDNLNVLFIALLVEINKAFRKRLLNDYKFDFN